MCIRDSLQPATADGTGEVPWTPVMRMLGDGITGAGFAQWVVVGAPADLGEGILAAALAAVVDTHDMLRARVEQGRLIVGERGSVDTAGQVRRVGLDGGSLDEAVEGAVRDAVGLLAPETGEMVQAVWVDAGPGRVGRLVMAVHHLAVDGVSWRILVPDLRAACEAAAAGRTPALEPVAVPFRRWASLLEEWAASTERVGELPVWQAILGQGDRPICGRELSTGSVSSRSWGMSGAEASALLGRVPSLFFCGVHEVLLAGLAGAVARWSGDHAVLVDVESHGRHAVGGLDLSRTVGWFTSVHPVRLDLSGIDLAPGDLLKAVKEQSRAVPDDGLGHGLLRHLNAETRPVLEAVPSPWIGFNYMGRFATGEQNDVAEWQQVGDIGGSLDPAMAPPHALQVDAVVRDMPGGPELTLMVSWPASLFEEVEIERFGRMWRDVLSGLARLTDDSSAGGHTASDFDLLDLDQDEIEGFEAIAAHFGGGEKQ